jgi:MFS family permease
MKTFNVKLLYIYKFISECLPIYAFYTILFIEREISVTLVAVLIALWSFFSIVFEIPSGILADRWNRRNMLAIAAVLKGFCFIIWYFSDNFLMFAFGFLLWGISGAFSSGTEEGLIYDNMKSDGNEENFATVYGKAMFFANAGIIVGIASAGIIANFLSIATIALISAAICFINVAFILHIREKNYYSERLEGKSNNFFDTFEEAGLFIKGRHVVLILILFSILFASFCGYLDEFDALIINDLELNYVWVSIILTVRFVFTAFGNLLAPIVQKIISSMRQVFLLSGLSGGFLIIFAALWHQYALIFFGLSAMVMAVTEILIINALQHEITEEGRATVLSFLSIGQNIVMICFSLIYALLADIFPLQQVYVLFSVYAIAGGFVFFLFCKKIRGIPR